MSDAGDRHASGPALQALVLALALMVASGALHAQGITTAAIEGRVTDEQTQAPMPDVVVTLRHEPSGSSHETITHAGGRYRMSGLRVGGPYTITLAGEGVLAKPRREVYLALGEVTVADFVSVTDVVSLSEMEVVAERESIFGYGKTGAGTDLSERQINGVPTIRRDIQDIMTLDPRLTLVTRNEMFLVTAQGQNARLNSILIDGIQAADPTGLAFNGFTSLRSPVPPEALEVVSVSLAPYDVRRAGFNGALINAVTKSGTNELHGSTYYEFTSQRLRGDNPITGVADPFDERSFGFTLGGPIIRDRLFFFASFDDFRGEAAPPTANFVPDPAQLQRITDRAQAAGGYDAGTLDTVNTTKQKTWLAKLDWNISGDHRLSLSARKGDGEMPYIVDYTGVRTTSLSNHWYFLPRVTTDYAAQLFSTWSPSFRTEASLSLSDFEASFKKTAPPYPQVTVNGVSGTRRDTGAAIADGTVVLGTANSGQMNALGARTATARFTGECSLGDHTLVFGVEADRGRPVGTSILGYYGNYTFSSIANWEAGRPVQGYTLSRPIAPYTIDDASPERELTMYGVYVEDVWRPHPRLTLAAGLRCDDPAVAGDPIPFNPAFYDGFGLRNDTTLAESPVLSPRLSFNCELPGERRTQVRGGLGLFQGRSPPIWIGESYLNTGVVGTVTLLGAAIPPDFTFNPDIATQAPPAGSPSAPRINVTDPDYIQPFVWKGNLAIDHTLPWHDFVLSAEFTWLRNEEISTLHFLNYRAAPTGPATMPDGRIRYAGTITPTGTIGGVTYPPASVAGRRRVSTFGDVYELSSIRAGEGTTFTLALTRPMRDNWAASLAFTRSRATDVNPFEAYLAADNYRFRAVFNPNEDVASTANTSIDDKVLITAMRSFHFVKRAPTTVSLIYEGRTGRPYSYVFRGDANGDGFTDNDRLYVPVGPDDPKVGWINGAERDAFFAFVESSGLARFRGAVVPRNSERAPWTDSVDLKITQSIPLGWRDSAAELYVTFSNFGNLLNDEWGRSKDVQSARILTAGTLFNPAANDGQGQFIYTFDPAMVEQATISASASRPDRWQVQVGMRLKF